MRRLLALAATLIGLTAPALAWAGGVSAHDAVIRATLGHTPNTAAYLTLVNDTDRPERLVSARCDCAGMVMIHQTEMSHGMAKMDDAPEAIIPAHGKLVFHPDGLHLMVMDVKRPLRAGDNQDITLIFDHGPPLTVRFAVRTVIDSGPAMGSMPGM